MEKEEMKKLLDELYSYSMHGIKLGLDNIRKICKELGDPQNDYKIIHITGTNGKGSVATTIETILLGCGYKIGKYTSPHILKFNERIRYNGHDMTDEEVAYYYEAVKKAIKKANVDPTFFEVTTAMMFKFFSDMKVDHAILEVGMGGRFDATNIASADICVITNVTLEHTQYLGNTIYKIAMEKAGIIKDCKNIIVADNDPEFLKAINDSRKQGSKVINVLQKYQDSKYVLDYNKFITKITISNRKYDFSLFGTYQYKNFLCAYETAKMLGIRDNMIAITVPNTVWPCRMEVYKKEPLVILDGAHNVSGMTELKNTILKGYKKEDITVITSILKDKDIKNMVKIIEEISDNIIFTSMKWNPRGTDGETLAMYLLNRSHGTVINDLSEAYKKALELNKKIILLCGSFYLLSRFKETISK